MCLSKICCDAPGYAEGVFLSYLHIPDVSLLRMFCSVDVEGLKFSLAHFSEISHDTNNKGRLASCVDTSGILLSYSHFQSYLTSLNNPMDLGGNKN